MSFERDCPIPTPIAVASHSVAPPTGGKTKYILIGFSTDPPDESPEDGGEVIVYVGVDVEVLVSEGVIVLVALAVKVGVSVAVAVGGTGVIVGRGVSVGGTSVNVGDTVVGSAVGVAHPPIINIKRMRIVENRIEFFDIFMETFDLYKDILLASRMLSEHQECIGKERTDLLFVLQIHFYTNAEK